MKKNNELFLLFNTGVDFSLHNNFANSGSFAKISVPVHIIIPCIYQGIIDIIPCIYTLSIWSCLLLQHHTHRRTQLPLSMHYTVAYTYNLHIQLTGFPTLNRKKYPLTFTFIAFITRTNLKVRILFSSHKASYKNLYSV